MAEKFTDINDITETTEENKKLDPGRSTSFEDDFDSYFEEKENDKKSETESDELKSPEQTNLDKQRIAIAEVESNDIDISSLGNKEKGNYGEIKTDLAMDELGYERISNETVTSLDDPIHNGIDGVYEKTNEDGSKNYCIVESKYGTSELGKLEDGTKQMSDKWIYDDERLVEAVGEEKAIEIELARLENPDSVESKLARIDPEGEVTFYNLDDDANIIKE